MPEYESVPHLNLDGRAPHSEFVTDEEEARKLGKLSKKLYKSK